MVLIEKFATGAVDAIPSRMVFTLPPSDQICQYETYDPVPLSGKKSTSTDTALVAASWLPTSGRTVLVNPISS
jgi:hypothetical protein